MLHCCWRHCNNRWDKRQNKRMKTIKVYIYFLKLWYRKKKLGKHNWIFLPYQKYNKYLLTVAGVDIVTLHGSDASPPRWLTTLVLFFVINWLALVPNKLLLLCCIFISFDSGKKGKTNKVQYFSKLLTIRIFLQESGKLTLIIKKYIMKTNSRAYSYFTIEKMLTIIWHSNDFLF